MLTVTLLALVFTAGLAVAQTTDTQPTTTEPTTTEPPRRNLWAMRQGIRRLQAHTNGILSRKCRPVFRVYGRPSLIPDGRVARSLDVWRGRHRYSHRVPRASCIPAALRYSAYLRIPSWIRGAFQTIHSCEGSWSANTGNGYYGGLQMDMTFQRSYGWDALREWGTANNWPWFSQVIVAERARASGRGFYPWPTCARRAGLI